MAKREIVLEMTLEGDVFNQFARLTKQQQQARAASTAVKKEIRELSAQFKAGAISEGQFQRATAAANRELARQDVVATNASVQMRELRNDLSGATAAGLRFRDKMARASTEALGAFGLQVATVTGAIVLLRETLVKGVEEARAQIQAEAQLAQALGYTSEALLEQATALQYLSGIGDQAIIQQQAFLASLGFTEDQIKTIIPAALDLAAATGQTLEFAVRNLAKTYSGLTGELGELIPELKNFTKEELEAGAATEYATKQFAGQAQAAREGSQGIEDFQNALGDLREELGKRLLPLINQIGKTMSEVFQGLILLLNDVEDTDFGEGVEKRLERMNDIRAKQIDLSSEVARKELETANSQIKALDAIVDSERKVQNAVVLRARLVEKLAAIEAKAENGQKITSVGLLRSAIYQQQIADLDGILSRIGLVGSGEKDLAEAIAEDTKATAANNAEQQKRLEIFKELQDIILKQDLAAPLRGEKELIPLEDLLPPEEEFSAEFDSIIATYQRGLTELELLDFQYKTGQIDSDIEYWTRRGELVDEYNDRVAASTAQLAGTLASFYDRDSQEFKAFAIIEASINAYRAASEALADKSAGPTRYAQAAIALAQGLSYVSAIQGFAEGGFTGPGSKYQPRGIVHAGEWVAPAWQVRSPQFAPIIDWLESQRKNRGGYEMPFVSGGFVPETISTADINSLEQRITAQLLANRPMYVDVVEINKAQGRVRVADTLSTA